MKYLLIFIVLIIGCSPKVYKVTDTKFYQEQYLCDDYLLESDINHVQMQFLDAGFTVEIEYITEDRRIIKCLVLTPAMIEYTKKNGKGILKKRHIKQLKNTL